MPDFVLAAAGAIVFALTTWASLTFGYQVFQNMWETDLAEGGAPTQPPTDDRATSLLVVDAPDADATRQSELVHPTAPAA